MILAGILSFLLGLTLVGGWFDWVLDIGGALLILFGAVLSIMGLVNILSGDRRRPNDY